MSFQPLTFQPAPAPGLGLSLAEIEAKLKELQQAIVTGKKLKLTELEVAVLTQLEGQLQLVTPANETIKEERNNLPLLGFIYNRFVTEGVGPFNITGIGVGNTGSVKVLFNTGIETLILKHESAKSSGLNRFKFSTGKDIELRAGFTLWIQHNGSRWVDVAASVLTAFQNELVTKAMLVKALAEELLTVAAYPGQAAYVSGTEETETRPVLITAVLKTKPEAASAKVKLEIDGKAETLEWNNGAALAAKIPFTFLVKRAGKWKATVEGAAESLTIARQAVSSL